ncbi:MAG TPA: hypothetical protein VML75_19290 [Kofleriaceae bacterium]|nr:hypothetical protein [Kofleriaceae bacterium]
MGQDPRPQARLVVLLGLVVLLDRAAPAAADPILVLPPAGRGRLSSVEADPALLAVVGEVSGIGIVATNEMSSLPGYGGLEGNRLELGLARVGVVAVHGRLPLAALVRVDFSEATRADFATDFDRPIAGVDRFLDDAQIWYRPAVWTELILGRQKVPFSRFRQLDQALLTAGVVPFLIDRVAPDRRWGLAVHGDLGALSYVAGGFEDHDALELRLAEAEPSAGGRGLVALHLEWTPRAPIGADHLPTPTFDPWHDTTRVSLGIGFLYRATTDSGAQRFDISTSAQLQRGRFAGLAELIITKHGNEVLADIAAEASVAITDRVMGFVRGDTDAHQELWSSGLGMSYFVTADRRNRVSLYGWARRETGASGKDRDGVIAQVQASL